MNKSGSKKAVSTLLALVCSASISGNAYALSFSDINSHWAKAGIESAAKEGLVTGYNGKYLPDAQTSKAEFASILDRMLHRADSASVVGLPTSMKTHWSRASVENLVRLGVIYNTEASRFIPTGTISRFEMATWLSRALATIDPSYADALNDLKGEAAVIPVSEFFKNKMTMDQNPAVGLMIGTGIMKGLPDGSFGFAKVATRAEVAAIALRFKAVSSKTADTFSELNELREVGVTGTNLTSLTPYKFGAPHGTIKDFSHVRNKTYTMDNGAGKIDIHRMLLVDADSNKEVKGVYGKLFINESSDVHKGPHYFGYMQITITPSINNFTLAKYLQGASGDGIVSGLHISRFSYDVFGIQGLPQGDWSKFFYKGKPVTFWVSSNFSKNAESEKNYVIKTDDGYISIYN
ncbi:hypothetical protein SY83_13005 [Paenibacillus swuensis]|uniref:SLH domain-containing protein n=1 Tax=Paenibacillus swuensis TaxID=1178515 RepID=A0A172TJ01_9BACL|nr:S-layer homology domain-containing protein [Paenibacillus swuensis]ANE47035.1 hypothetical protein SY83_13005 [Paenibacillus swuensis]